MIALLIASSIVACDEEQPVNLPDIDPGPVCEKIAWDLLLTSDEPLLSTYQLFSVKTNPTAGANDTGIPYSLNTELFTDYSSKYRFIFMPCDSAAIYVADETFIFPIGTTIAKTFTMPADTGLRGFAHETLIETRLLIKRVDGWVTLPYVWPADGSEAILSTDGSSVPMSVTHKGNELNFNYAIPSQKQCASCHILDDVVTPIGPKASNLNGQFEYNSGLANQLSHWQSVGQLTDLPANISTLKTMPLINDDTDFSTLTIEADRNLYAKAYLDINCAHCHRPQGSLGDRTPYYEFWREINLSVMEDNHGICRTIIPGSASGSGLHSMMRIRLMPKIGTSIVHSEGLALIDYWIDNMSGECP